MATERDFPELPRLLTAWDTTHPDPDRQDEECGLWLWANMQERLICHHCNGSITSADDIAAILIVPHGSDPKLAHVHRLCAVCAPDEATALELAAEVRL